MTQLLQTRTFRYESRVVVIWLHKIFIRLSESSNFSIHPSPSNKIVTRFMRYTIPIMTTSFIVTLQCSSPWMLNSIPSPEVLLAIYCVRRTGGKLMRFHVVMLTGIIFDDVLSCRSAWQTLTLRETVSQAIWISMSELGWVRINTQDLCLFEHMFAWYQWCLLFWWKLPCVCWENR